VNIKNNQIDQKMIQNDYLVLFLNFAIGPSAQKGSQSKETFATRVNLGFHPCLSSTIAAFSPAFRESQP